MNGDQGSSKDSEVTEKYPMVHWKSQKERPPVRCDKKYCLKDCTFGQLLTQFCTLGYVREHIEFEVLLPRLMPRSSL